MAQHLWLSKRAQTLQDATLSAELDMRDQERQFALFLRYQTTNDRAFHKCLATLLKLRAEKRRAEIGFESQKQKQAQEVRRDSNEKRQQELHESKISLLQAKLDRQIRLNSSLEGVEKRSAQAA
jgi:hypothetical protein